MLKGKIVTLRPLREEDLPQMYAYNLDLDNRGEFFGRSIRTMTEMRKDLNTNGLWARDLGVLGLIDNESSKLIGQIAYYDTVRYMDELEIGYILYEQSKRRRGSMSEALRLLTRYLFDTRPAQPNPAVHRHGERGVKGRREKRWLCARGHAARRGVPKQSRL